MCYALLLPLTLVPAPAGYLMNRLLAVPSFFFVALNLLPVAARLLSPFARLAGGGGNAASFFLQLFSLVLMAAIFYLGSRSGRKKRACIR